METVTGQDALDKVATQRPKVVLLDLEMPVMDGFASLHAFHEQLDRVDIPVIVITARNLTREDRRNLQGVNRVLAKGEMVQRELPKELLQVTQIPGKDATGSFGWIAVTGPLPRLRPFRLT